MWTPKFITFALLAAAPFAAAHGKISAASGDLGGNGTGLGIIGSAASVNSEEDVTIFTAATGFGETPGGGAIDAATALTAMIALTGTTIPQVSTDAGVLTMTYHQVNADGAGPITCSVSSDATNEAFTAMTITTNVAGTNGDSAAADEDFPLVASMPAGTTCTGTIGSTTNVCTVKCANPVGPFGGTVPVQQAAAAAAKIIKTRRVGSLAARAKAMLDV